MSANEEQIGGEHYAVAGEFQHWDFAEKYNLSPTLYGFTKYLIRYKRKDGVTDLKKAIHFLNKRVEILFEKHANIDTDISRMCESYLAKDDSTVAIIRDILTTPIQQEINQITNAVRILRIILNDYTIKMNKEREEAQEELDLQFSTKENLNK